MFSRNMMIVVVAIVLLSSSTYASETQTIYIETVGEGKFDVLYYRVLSTATGAAIAGFIGAGIQSGVEASKDNKKTEEISPLIKKDAWKTRFLDTLNDKLESKGFEAVWVGDGKDAGEGHVLRIYPDRYGFKIVDTSNRLVSAYIDFKASFSSNGSKKAREQEKESYYLTNRNQHPYDDLLKEGSPVNEDLEAVLEKAARRLANKIIYSLKE